MLDRMYKGILEDGDLDSFSQKDVEIMKYLANKRRLDLLEHNEVLKKINL